MQVEEDRSAQLAVAEERVRIARELHDIVAHGVSLMTIQIAAARRVGVSKPETATESLEAAEQTGRQTLSELEGMLAVLRGADASIGAAASSTPPGRGPCRATATAPRRSRPTGAGRFPACATSRHFIICWTAIKPSPPTAGCSLRRHGGFIPRSAASRQSFSMKGGCRRVRP